jgi:hypothetical protein
MNFFTAPALIDAHICHRRSEGRRKWRGCYIHFWNMIAIRRGNGEMMRIFSVVMDVLTGRSRNGDREDLRSVV